MVEWLYCYYLKILKWITLEQKLNIKMQNQVQKPKTKNKNNF